MSDGLGDSIAPAAQRVGIHIGALDAEQVESFAGFEIHGDDQYAPPVWPEVPGEHHQIMHLEIQVDNTQACVGRAIDDGGTRAPHQPPDRDPAGHPLCLFLRGE